MYPLTLGRHGPRQLFLVPADVWPGDAQKGAAMIAGRFAHQGETIEADLPSWAPGDVGPEMLAALHGFEWLRDLRVLGGDGARRFARSMVGAWIDRNDRWDPLIWRPDVLGQRLCAWLGAHDFFCASAEDAFRQRIFACLNRQLRHLGRTVPGEVEGASLIAALKALIYGSLCLTGDRARLNAALRHLDRALDRQILGDGGHIGRNPAVALDVLRHLVDIRAALRAGSVPVPQALQGAIDRMAPGLRFFRHGDGGLALFNGAWEGEEMVIDAALTRADARARPVKSARHSGFERVWAGRTLLLMDVGSPPPEGFDAAAHAGSLALEVSIGRERLIVNCGAYPARSNPDARSWRTALRGTAAHSTLTLNDANSSAVDPEGGLTEPCATVTAERHEADGAVWIDASHDGYVTRFGAVHRRRLYVNADGDDLRGEDLLDGPADTPFAVRFHLHPAVHASVTESGATVLLRLYSGLGWQLSAAGADLTLEDSVYFGQAEGPRNTRQIVLSGTTGADGAAVQWALSRVKRTT